MGKILLSLGQIIVNCHSDRAKRVKNLYRLGLDLTDASAKFILCLPKGFTSPHYDKLIEICKLSHGVNQDFIKNSLKPPSPAARLVLKTMK
jgi:hypothetical protein